MKTALLILGMISFFTFSSFFNPDPGPKKIALIVAVGKYPEGGRWKSLSSANDLRYVKASLMKNGFTEADIDTLQDAKATKAGILKELDALYAKAGTGDIVVFHFSGHGQQIADDNGDEADGYDEALIPYDAEAIFDPVSYTGQNHLRDDELGAKLARIREKIGSKGSLVVVLDACHSGTATRGNEFAICRGESIPFQKPGYKPKTTFNMNDLATQEAGMFSAQQDAAANMIVFSASSPNQVNYETKDQNNIGVGSLSYAFAKGLSDLKAGCDYELLYQKIKSQIQANYPMQIPLIEGNTKQEIFSGNYVKRPEVITIQKWFNDSTFSINMGSLNSLQSGTTLKILSLNGTDQVAEGYIKQVTTFQSICVANKHLSTSDAYQVKMDAVNNGNFSASVFIKNAADKPGAALQKQVTNLIKPFPFISISDNADFMLDISKAASGSKISLIEKGDSIRWSRALPKGDTLSSADFTELLGDIKKAMRIKYFRTMSDGGALAQDASVEIIPKKPAANATDLTLKPLDIFDVKLTNNGPNTLYYTIIDLMPDNEVKVLIPAEVEEPQDRVLRPGQSITITDIEVDQNTPRGKEFFKVVFTKTPMDLRNVFNRKSTRAVLSSFEQVVDDMFKDGTSKATTRANITVSNVKVDEVGILTRGFTIAN